jgi:glycine cleavage system aminomethyltransferase T
MTGTVGPEQGAFFDLSDRVKLRVTGSDRVRYVNGQISNDVRKARDAEAIHACVLTAKGKINADVFIRADGESLLIDTGPDLREALAARLERYVIADDVTIEDVTDAFALFHVLGPNVPTLSAAHAQVRADRFGCGGADLWLAAADCEAAAQELGRALVELRWRTRGGVSHRARHPELGPRADRRDHSDRGESRGGSDRLRQRLLHRAGGDFPHQDVRPDEQAALRFARRVRCGAHARDAAAESEDGKEVGWITSAAISERVGRQIALGYLKRGFQTPGLELNATSPAGETAVVVVTPLPFI